MLQTCESEIRMVHGMLLISYEWQTYRGRTEKSCAQSHSTVG
jgi:hypothetical protein